MAFTHVDCFCGPGGFCTGLHAAGFETLVAIDYVKSCTDTYKTNHPEVHVIHSDIRKVSESDLMEFIPDGGVDLVTSGMPCETFSTAGNSSRSFYDDRQVLFREGIRIANICNAKMVLFENVPAIRTKKLFKDSDVKVVDVLYQELRDAGYVNCKEFILNAEDFGIPQHRERFFVLACKDPDVVLKPPSYDGPRVTIAEAFAGLPDVIPNSDVDGVMYTGDESEYSRKMKDSIFWNRPGFDHILTHQHPPKHRAKTIERFKLLNAGDNLGALFDRYRGEKLAEFQANGILPKKKFIGRNHKLIPTSQSPTVTSHCLDEFVHPDHHRALTVRECARLQSFPDSY